MRIAIIGAVAAGTSAAAKARRNNEDAEITIFEMDQDISYSSCGLPYYIGGHINDRNEIVPRNADYFKKKYNVDVLIRHQVMHIDSEKNRLKIKNLVTGQLYDYEYDKLIIASGAKPTYPQIKGVENGNVFILRNVESADKILDFIEDNNPGRAVIIGAGFIGLEMAENLSRLGIHVTMVDLADQVMTAMDKDMANHIEDYLRKRGIQLKLGRKIVEIDKNHIHFEDGEKHAMDFAILSTGVAPNTELAMEAGVELGPTKAIKVNNRLETNIKNIYACGDCAETYSLINGKPIYRPLGSTANKMGRIAGDQVSGGNLEFRGILGTGIFKIFDLSVAFTGMTEKEALQEGYNLVVCHNIKPDKPEYMNGKEMVIKAIADKSDGKLLGVQIVGREGVDKRIDVFATAMTYGAKAEDLFHLDLAYTPVFSTTKDPVMYTGMILDNILNRERKLVTFDELVSKTVGEKVTIIDTRAPKQFKEGHIEGAINIPQEELRSKAAELDSDAQVITYCNKGVTGNACQNILINMGFKKVYNLSGGHKNYKIQKK